MANYAQGHQTMYRAFVEKSKMPMKRPEGLGTKIPTPEQQIEDIDNATIAIYERFAKTVEKNMQMRDEFSDGIVEKSKAPAERPDRYILEGLYKERPNKYLRDLKNEFPELSLKQISAIIGNLDHESRGFTKFYEEGVSVGGEGDAQWTATRRNEFRKFAKENNLDPKSYEASRDFLIYELKNDRTHGFVNWPELDSFNDPSKSASELAVLFESRYLRAKKKRLERRKKLAEQYYTEFSQRNMEER